MRLPNAETFALEEFFGLTSPPYAILSHTWGNDRDVLDGRLKAEETRPVKVSGCSEKRSRMDINMSDRHLLH